MFSLKIEKQKLKWKRLKPFWPKRLNFSARNGPAQNETWHVTQLVAWILKRWRPGPSFSATTWAKRSPELHWPSISDRRQRTTHGATKQRIGRDPENPSSLRFAPFTGCAPVERKRQRDRWWESAVAPPVRPLAGARAPPRLDLRHSVMVARARPGRGVVGCLALSLAARDLARLLCPIVHWRKLLEEKFAQRPRQEGYSLSARERS
jgi:hypothetical protein